MVLTRFSWIFVLLTVTYNRKILAFKDYEGYHLVTVRVPRIEDVHVLVKLQEKYHNEMTLLSSMTTRTANASFVVSRDVWHNHVRRALLDEELPAPLVVEHDFRKTLDRHYRSSSRASTEQDNFDLNVYHTYDEIMEWLLDLPLKYDIFKVRSIGLTFELREMYVLEINVGDEDKPVVWIDAGIHAREWIAPATCLKIIDYFRAGYEQDDKDVMNMISDFHWVFLPIANPDGYAFTWTDDRLWRKTRSDTGEDCIGTDPNRNFDFHWAEAGSSYHPCSEIFHGPEPFSEIETRNMAAEMERLAGDNNNLLMYLSLHSYYMMILYPFGYAYEVPANHKELRELGLLAANAMFQDDGSVYIVGPSASTIYPSAGASDDWALGVAGARFSYTVELPPGQADSLTHHSFDLPPEYIDATGRNFWVGLKAMAGGLKWKLRQRYEMNDMF